MAENTMYKYKNETLFSIMHVSFDINLLTKYIWQKNSMLPPKLPRFCDQFLPKITDSKFKIFSSRGFEKAPGTWNEYSVAMTSLPTEEIGL